VKKISVTALAAVLLLTVAACASGDGGQAANRCSNAASAYPTCEHSEGGGTQ
jgi:hypothetical protein